MPLFFKIHQIKIKNIHFIQHKWKTKILCLWGWTYPPPPHTHTGVRAVTYKMFQLFTHSILFWGGVYANVFREVHISPSLKTFGLTPPPPVVKMESVTVEIESRMHLHFKALWFPLFIFCPSWGLQTGSHLNFVKYFQEVIVCCFSVISPNELSPKLPLLSAAHKQ